MMVTCAVMIKGPPQNRSSLMKCTYLPMSILSATYISREESLVGVGRLSFYRKKGYQGLHTVFFSRRGRRREILFSVKIHPAIPSHQ